MAPTTNKESLRPELAEAGIDARGTRLGDMAVGFERWPVGDYTPLFKGLPGDACVAEHYGYVLRGRGTVRNADGSTDEIGPGDVYYAPPGHTFEVTEPIKVVEFSPVNTGYEQTMAAFERNLPAFLRALKA